MFILENEELSLEIVDPEKDRELLGTRFCTGGHVFQIRDHEGRCLLSGPTYPESYNTFDAQGLTDCFNHAPLLDYNISSTEGIVLGIGVCDFKENSIRNLCSWSVNENKDSISFSTEHKLGIHNLEFIRSIHLSGREVIIETEIRNRGSKYLPLSWYPHPFFPRTENKEICSLDFPFSFEPNAGYIKSGSKVLWKNSPDRAGFFQPLEINIREGFSLDVLHPICGRVKMKGSYPVSSFPIWGNVNTFSLEPYLERTIFPGTAYKWFISYSF